jgi:hypothetical protein
LDLADVVILDICPLSSDSRLSVIGFSERADAIEQTYGLTKEILKCLKPKIMLSCQCQTSTDKWNAAQNALADKLCSSCYGAQNGKVEVVDLEDHAIQAIQAFHPMHILYEQDDSAYLAKTTILKNLFKRVYSSCASRKAEVQLLMEAWKIVSSAGLYHTVVKAGVELFRRE